MLESRFTTLPEHAPIVEGGADCIHIPEDRGTVAGAENLVLSPYQEAAVGVAAALEVVL